MVTKTPTKPKLGPGFKTGDLTVVEYVGFKLPEGWLGGNKQHLYRALCSCGRERIVLQNYLMNETIKLKHCETCALEYKRKRGRDYQRRKKLEREREAAEAYRPVSEGVKVLKTWKPPKSVLKKQKRGKK